LPYKQPKPLTGHSEYSIKAKKKGWFQNWNKIEDASSFSEAIDIEGKAFFYFPNTNLLVQRKTYNQTNQKHHLLYLPLVIKRELVYAISFLIVVASSFFVFDLIGSFDPRSVFRFGFIKNDKDSSQSAACDYSRGRWVRDESYKNLSYTESCPFLDPGFRCLQNGKKGTWTIGIGDGSQKGVICQGRNGRVVFAGDFCWQKPVGVFLCMLAQGVSNKSSIYEENGNPITKHKGFLSMRFSEYNLTGTLSCIHRPPTLGVHRQASKMTIKVDQLHWFSRNWEGADVLMFNTGHWWNEDKTVKIVVTTLRTEHFKNLFRHGSHGVENLSHERDTCFLSWLLPRNGTWDEGGRCDVDIQPEANYMMLEPEPVYNQIISAVIKEMDYGDRKGTTVTRLVIREPGTPVDAPQDCSHWCLPGIPDTWNEILYANFIVNGNSE
ncbi:protein trichome birefringence-like 8 isoform X2, partial [Populus alba x Populus x berolinensis]